MPIRIQRRRTKGWRMPEGEFGGSIMKVLTLTQPWATLVAIGAKKVETRSWNTSYRGPLLIHAAKSFPRWARKICHEPYFITALSDYCFHTLPLGAIVAKCDLVKVVRIYVDTEIPGKPELVFGDYTVGRYMWFLENIQILPEPIPARGALGLWEWNESGE